ncbi:MAG: chemotaxis response regulator protein-glutamate methylesterase [SAR324 cluster bacterium]|nr:chemotaxis response regulator protein-glutamate methylesterase [SAR324 cluster bacterium]
MAKKIRVLVVDDSALVRQILTQGLNNDPDIEVVGSAPDPYVARDKIVELNPDVLTLDVEMPRMDGVEFLRKLMPQFPLPVVIVSSLAERGCKITLDALDAGAVDFVTKPSSNVMGGLSSMMGELCAKVKVAAKVDVSQWKGRTVVAPKARIASHALSVSTDKVIAIGASTGGTEALRKVLERLPSDIPGIVIVQHMPPKFTKMFADRLNDVCAIDVKEAQNGDRIIKGLALVAPGDAHMTVIRSGGTYVVDCTPGEKVCGHCPSVEVMFNSVAKYVGANAVGVMLTGMGRDGADAMLNMRKAGARTMAQDEKSSVVFGMPKEAYERGGAEKLVALDNIPEALIQLLNQKTP